MSINRIQKLLFSEYCDFEDMVLVESPFAETTREGCGLRQVNIGLTPSKLVMATDILPVADESIVHYFPGLDPEIETLELVAVYPIECVNLSIFHKRKRQSIKARFCNNKVLYFELGGFEKRNMFWNLWCEKVKFLNPDDANFSHSETSVATSTTNSTLYLVSSRQYMNRGNSQIWCQYAAGDFARSNTTKWTDKHLYLGKLLDESPLKYTPCQLPPTQEEFINKPFHNINKDAFVTPNTTYSSSSFNQVNRFSSGVTENCSTALFLPVDDYTLRNKKFAHSTQSVDVFTMYQTIHDHPESFSDLAESAVRLWEMRKITSSASTKHRRRYAISPHPHFLHGLGPWNVDKGERYSLQMKRAVSMVRIRRQPIEPELRLSVSRRQLIASISCENLRTFEDSIKTNFKTKRNASKPPMIFFWTPEYWYRPRSAKDAYQELQNHLRKIYQYHHIKDTFRRRIYRPNRRKQRSNLSSASSTDRTNRTEKSYVEKIKSLNRVSREKFSETFQKIGRRDFHSFDPIRTGTEREGSVQFLKRILRLEVSLSAWDFDSNTIAQQLTLIDKDLFLKITPSELCVLSWQQSSKNSPNIGAFIAFSHRISCLVVTEILKDDSEKIRARLAARFISIAEKCHHSSNFQSCRSLLCGLQSPPVYRLCSMWTLVRKRHSTRYSVFEKLCRLYRDPRMPSYQTAFNEATKTKPYLPFIGDLIFKLLNKVDKDPELNSNSTRFCANPDSLGIKVSVKSKNEETKMPANTKTNEEMPSLIRKILSSLRVWQNDNNGKTSAESSVIKCGSLKIVDRNSKKSFQLVPEDFIDERVKCLKDCLRSLEDHQRAALYYNYPKNELAREYLLKARYREDQENFMQSFKIEPPQEFRQHFTL